MNYLCISFGNIPGSSEWYNEGSRHSCAFTAERWGLDLMPIQDVSDSLSLERTMMIPGRYWRITVCYHQTILVE